MTPAEELLAAVKEHATVKDQFDYAGGKEPRLIVRSNVYPPQSVVKSKHGWLTDHMFAQAKETLDDSASSAVYSAFLRARK